MCNRKTLPSSGRFTRDGSKKSSCAVGTKLNSKTRRILLCWLGLCWVAPLVGGSEFVAPEHLCQVACGPIERI